MFYDNKVCDGCSEIMLEGDDIVVCPECGTPQHRECYNKNNECVNAHLHAEGFDWRQAHAEASESETAQESAANSESVQKEESSDAQPKSEFESSEGLPNMPPMPEFRIDGVYIKGQTYDADEDIGGATVREVVTYTQVNFKHYIKKLIKNRNKRSFFLSGGNVSIISVSPSHDSATDGCTLDKYTPAFATSENLVAKYTLSADVLTVTVGGISFSFYVEDVISINQLKLLSTNLSSDAHGYISVGAVLAAD